MAEAADVGVYVAGEPVEDGVLRGWTKGSFSLGDNRKETYQKGTGRAVIIIHEIPNIHQKVVDFANEVVDKNFQVIMPSLVGTPGAKRTAGACISSVFKMWISGEYTTCALNQTSPVIIYLRALARYMHGTCGGPGVGVIGMCFSGGFALGMMVDGHVAAPVLSQPSLPFPFTAAQKQDLNLSIEDLAAVKEVCGRCPVLGLAYEKDWFSGKGARFARLEQELRENFIKVTFEGGRHAVLTIDYQPEAVKTVLDFLHERLNV